MTGLTRKEVKRVRDQLAEDNASFAVKSTPLVHILHRWHSVTDFLDEEGLPLSLPFAGEGKSFTELVRRFGGDIPPGAMRTELRRVGAVEEDSSGNLSVVRRDVHPPVPLDNLCMTLLHGAYPLLSNIAKNTDPDRDDRGWPQITAFAGDVPERDLIRLRRICADKAKGTMTSFDDILMAFEDGEGHDEPKESVRPVAIGIFYFEEQDSQAYSIWNS